MPKLMTARLAPLLLLPLVAFAAPGAAVSVKDLKFTPATVTVPAGSSVTWTNADTRDYTVTAADGSFDSGTLSPGKSFTHTFPRAGRYPYKSKVHPRMKATVIVTE